MAAQPTGHSTRRGLGFSRPRVERRNWLSHGLAALAISALGLAVAGSVSLTTNAQTNVDQSQPASSLSTSGSSSRAGGEVVSAGSGELRLPGTAQASTARTSRAARSGTLAAFSRPGVGASDTAAGHLRAAIVTERAARRAEDLAKSAEDVTRTARDEGTEARGQNLAATDRKTREAAVQLAQARLRRAIAARIAAESNREQAETGATATSQVPTTPGTSSSENVDTSSIPSGSGGASPVPGAVIGAHFGQYGSWSRYHTGLDFRAAHGTPIRAVKAGVVVHAGNSGDWAGNHVAIRHADGMTTMSSHMSSMSVSSGTAVQVGQVIGYVGQTGRAFGAHLHFELYPAGVKYGDVYKAVNPVPWLRSNGVQTR